MKRIAMYGKGGIGKSTLAGNLSPAMALKGAHVLQVGCDPKQDSTRLLLRGRTITTALDYLRTTPPQRRRLEDIVHTGFAGVSCVKAGGPKPGIGCAGRGILRGGACRVWGAHRAPARGTAGRKGGGSEMRSRRRMTTDVALGNETRRDAAADVSSAMGTPRLVMMILSPRRARSRSCER